MLQKFFAEMIQRAGNIDHRTVWCQGPIYNQLSQSEVFLLCTTDLKRSREIHDCLERNGLLCQTDLGKVSICENTEV